MSKRGFKVIKNTQFYVFTQMATSSWSIKLTCDTSYYSSALKIWSVVQPRWLCYRHPPLWYARVPLSQTVTELSRVAVVATSIPKLPPPIGGCARSQPRRSLGLGLSYVIGLPTEQRWTMISFPQLDITHSPLKSKASHMSRYIITNTQLVRSRWFYACWVSTNDMTPEKS